MKTKLILRIGASALLALFLATLPSTALAGGQNPPTGNSPGGASRGDEVGTAPRLAGPKAPGFVLQVDPSRLETVLMGRRGRGNVSIERNADGSFTLTFTGRQLIRVARQDVLSGQVEIGYAGFTNRGRVVQHKRSLFLIQR
jgi:hypothetical protein